MSRGRSARELIASAFNWVFRNRNTGAITVVQLPNLALWIFLALVVLRRVLPEREATPLLDWAAVVALSWWALDEVLRGVNPWRRFLGLLGCAAVIVQAASLLW